MVHNFCLLLDHTKILGHQKSIGGVNTLDLTSFQSRDYLLFSGLFSVFSSRIKQKNYAFLSCTMEN